VYFQPDCFTNADARQRQSLHGEKGLSLFLKPEKTQEFLKKYIGILALLLFTICANLKKNRTGIKKVTRFLNFFAWGFMRKKVKLISQAGKNSGIF